jgi:hypothetical protein
MRRFLAAPRPAVVAGSLVACLLSVSCAEGVDPGPPPVGRATSGGGNGEGGDGVTDPAGGTSAMGGTGDFGGAGGASGGASGTGGTPDTDAATSGAADDASEGAIAANDGAPDDASDACTSPSDRDHDGQPDCSDGCPDDPAKVAPGVCGCGTPESCIDLKNALVHRYRFLGMGTQATDSVGTAHGTVVNTTLSGSGTVVLAGGTSDQYVNLPNDIIHTLTNATFESWITWQGGNAWQRIFDFGDELTQTENAQGTGRSYLFFTATTGGAAGVLRSAFQKAGSTETIVNSVKPMPVGAMTHVAVVADDQNNKLSIYLNGALEASTTWNDSLSLIHDINVWLGRSQYAADPELGATYHEFRIYNVALSPDDLALSAKLGPDPGFLD